MLFCNPGNTDTSHNCVCRICYTKKKSLITHSYIFVFTWWLFHGTVVVHLPGVREVWVRIPLVELIFPSFFPFYLSSSPSDLHTPPFFQSTRREIGSETTDNLSVKNTYRASTHALSYLPIPTSLFCPHMKAEGI